jgi:Fe-Mn family superoxide dismutase
MDLDRREMLGGLGTLAVGGWLGLGATETLAQPKEGEAAPAGEYTLPPLPYAADALEPHIDAQTMTLHHDKHHKAYVDGLNKALANLAAARKSGTEAELAKVGGLTMEVAFHGSGHALHSIFWPNMKKGGGGEPSGSLTAQIAQDFGDVASMKAEFSAAAKSVKGSGWGILAWEPLGKRLVVLSAYIHQNYTVFGCVPLLVLDVWEHAYYLKYQNNRGEYVKAFWNVVNWEDVAARLDAAKKLG